MKTTNPSLAKHLLIVNEQDVNGESLLDYIDREISASEADSKTVLNIDEIVAVEARIQTLKEIKARVCLSLAVLQQQKSS
jgi:hypothetical protein